MTDNQFKDILDGINVSLLRLNDRIDKLEAAKEQPQTARLRSTMMTTSSLTALAGST